MAEIFVVDDDTMLQELLVDHLRNSGYSARGASTLREGLAQAGAGNYDVVFLDVRLPDGNGLEYLPRFKAVSSAPEVIIITGQGDEDGAEKAILSGAWSYIEKPDVVKELLLHLTRALQYRKEKMRAERIPLVLKRDAIIGNSPLLIKCLGQVAEAAFSDASVLITGETGTGKELFARAIHENSARADKNFIVVDCASLPDTLVESTLFGHVRGAFTGAERTHEGLVSQADGGTLFLDEVGELPPATQKNFLRVLQEQVYRPVGSASEKKSGFRVIAATNRNVEECVEQGNFRSDLLYRLKAFSLSIPRLRERKEDIRLLAHYFMVCQCERLNLESKGISTDFIEHLEGYDWPGNVRELQQTMEQVIAAARYAHILFASHLPEHFRIRHARTAIRSGPVKTTPPAPVTETKQLPWKDYRELSDRQYVIDLMHAAEGSVAKACSLSGLSRTRLYQLRDKYKLLNIS